MTALAFDIETITLRLAAWSIHADALDAYENDGSPATAEFCARAADLVERFGVDEWRTQLEALKPAPIPLVIAFRDVEEAMHRIRLGEPWN